MDLRLCESFIAIVDSGTVVAAARKLNVSQSALSRRLQQLETDLGMQLLVRRRDGVELTPAGHRALVVCSQLLDQFGSLRRELQAEADPSTGVVRIGGGATATLEVLSRCVGSLHSTNPGLRFYIREAGSQSTAAAVAHGDLDIGIVTTPVDVDGLDLEPLLDDRVVLVGHDPPASQLRLENLHERPLIAFQSGTAIRKIIDHALTTLGIEMPIVAEVRSVPTMLRLVRVTGLSAFVSTLSLQDHQSDVLEIQVPGLRIRRTLAIATRKGVAPTEPVSIVLRALRDAVEAANIS